MLIDIPNKGRERERENSQTPDIVLALSSEDYIIHITRGFSDTVMVGTIQLTPSYMQLARLCKEVNSVHLFPRKDKNNLIQA